MGHQHELCIVTSRQHVIRDVTMEWLDRHFGLHLFSGVHFGNHFSMTGASRSKSEICMDIGAHVLVDDNPSYAFDCASHGVHVLLFNWDLRYPWSQVPDRCALFGVIINSE